MGCSGSIPRQNEWQWCRGRTIIVVGDSPIIRQGRGRPLLFATPGALLFARGWAGGTEKQYALTIHRQVGPCLILFAGFSVGSIPSVTGHPRDLPSDALMAA